MRAATRAVSPLGVARESLNTLHCADAPVAQLDRASGFEPEGREFESLRARIPMTAAPCEFRLK